MGSEGVCEGLCIAAPMYSRGLMVGGRVEAPWGHYVAISGR